MNSAGVPNLLAAGPRPYDDLIVTVLCTSAL
jgi:hypothetical protein